MSLAKDLLGNNFIAQGIDAVAGVVQDFAKTRIGKVVLVAAAIYTGAYLLGGGTMAGLSTFATANPILYASLQGAAIGALGGAATGKDENILKGAAIGGVIGAGVGMYNGAVADPNLLSGGETLGSLPDVTAGGVDITSMGVTGNAAGGANITAGGMDLAGGGGISGWAANNPMLAYGAVQGATGLIGGLAAGDAQQAQIDENARIERERIAAEKARFDRAQISNIPGFDMQQTPLQSITNPQQQQRPQAQSPANVLNPQALLPQVVPTPPVPGQTMWAPVQ